MRLVSPQDVTQTAVPIGHASLTDDMARFLSSGSDGSTAELLRELRAAFPDSPLAVRVRALAALQRR